MIRPSVLLMCSALALAACDTSASRLGSDGRPLPQVYKLNAANEGRVQLRIADSVNSLRKAKGLTPVALNASLNAAAATHARDMSVQNRPWHFGSDGSSPPERVQRAGYSGRMLGELISETYETELETLAAWMENPDTRAILLQPEVRDIGFGYYQEPNGKIWWTMETGG
ncbi:MAG: CAP domain-containing protein [Gemmobacter sp.]|nr:CAP domain-containing protein [Gemmobacter sp.]